MTGFAAPPSTIDSTTPLFKCVKYAVAVANDKDGYTGIQFCRWMADVVGKKEHIDWDKFK